MIKEVHNSLAIQVNIWTLKLWNSIILLDFKISDSTSPPPLFLPLTPSVIMTHCVQKLIRYSLQCHARLGYIIQGCKLNERNFRANRMPEFIFCYMLIRIVLYQNLCETHQIGHIWNKGEDISFILTRV